MEIMVYLCLLIFALIGWLQALYCHTLIGWFKAPEPMVVLRVTLTLMFTRTSAQKKYTSLDLLKQWFAGVINVKTRSKTGKDRQLG